MPKQKPKPKRPAHRPEHEPTKQDRDTVQLMVAAGIEQIHIATNRGISRPTLRKQYKKELAGGATAINGIVIAAHIKRILAGDFNAIKFWEQARMGWSEKVVVDDGKPAGTPMRVVVEFVGDAAPARDEPPTPRPGSRLPPDPRVEWKG
jgi:hypothetical protein